MWHVRGRVTGASKWKKEKRKNLCPLKTAREERPELAYSFNSLGKIPSTILGLASGMKSSERGPINVLSDMTFGVLFSLSR